LGLAVGHAVYKFYESVGVTDDQVVSFHVIG
jgi:hypothetical protein